ncbi:hypothetical protein BHE74_00045567 [Ensete ventricosum]|nr:hypothetical protein BHE74_00045567 [Ensete ventricosum]
MFGAIDGTVVVDGSGHNQRVAAATRRQPWGAASATLLCTSELRSWISDGVEEVASAGKSGKRRPIDRERWARLGAGNERRKGDGRDGRRRWQGGEEQRWSAEEEATEGEISSDVWLLQ